MIKQVILVVAMLCFLAAAIAKEHNSQWLAIGLVFFAGSFLIPLGT